MLIIKSGNVDTRFAMSKVFAYRKPMPDQSHLCKYERQYIEWKYGCGVSIRKIAKGIRRAPSTVSREIKRNSFGVLGYMADSAALLYKARRRWAAHCEHPGFHVKRVWRYPPLRPDRLYICWYSDTLEYDRRRSPYPNFSLSRSAQNRRDSLFRPSDKPEHYTELRFLYDYLRFHKDCVLNRPIDYSKPFPYRRKKRKPDPKPVTAPKAQKAKTKTPEPAISPEPVPEPVA
ncbi:helix-turn-helix domain-containing protein [Fulvitalea axinellae]